MHRKIGLLLLVVVPVVSKHFRRFYFCIFLIELLDLAFNFERVELLWLFYKVTSCTERNEKAKYIKKYIIL